METTTEPLHGVEFELGDPEGDGIWLRYGEQDFHYLLPAGKPITINGKEWGRAYLLQWLVANREHKMLVDLTSSVDADGLLRIEAATFKRA